MYVGDVLLSAREAVPDLPGVIPNPATEIVFSAAAGTPPLAAGNYFVVATYSNLWGETGIGPEVQVSVNNGAIAVDVSQSAVLQFITSVNVYIGRSAGAEIQKFTFTAPFNSPLMINGGTAFLVATPPDRNSAFLPDSPGSVASVSQVYRWLTDALNQFSALNGGIPDMSGFSTLTGKANYVVPGDWQSMSDAWYDGYPLDMGSSSLVFRHNTITALAGMMSFTQVADTLVVELFAQPDRTAGVASLSAALPITGAVAQLAPPMGWVLPFGLAQIGVPPNYEIVSYTMGANMLNGLVRGLGGTNAAPWAAGTPVFELNAMFKGLRAPQLYAPGMAANTLRLPSTWVPLVHMYLLGRYRRIEQQEDEAQKLIQAFQAGARDATKKNPTLGDRQINPQDSVGVEVYPLLSREFGGGIIP